MATLLPINPNQLQTVAADPMPVWIFDALRPAAQRTPVSKADDRIIGFSSAFFFIPGMKWPLQKIGNFLFLLALCVNTRLAVRILAAVFGAIYCFVRLANREPPGGHDARIWNVCGAQIFEKQNGEKKQKPREILLSSL